MITQNQIRNTLSRALSIIENPNNWIKNTEAIDANKESVLPEDPTAVKYCLIGALEKSSYELFPDITRYAIVVEAEKQIEDMIEKIPTIKEYLLGLEEFNDAPETKHEDVIHILEKTIANL